jgi:hypothetical protein
MNCNMWVEFRSIRFSLRPDSNARFNYDWVWADTVRVD